MLKGICTRSNLFSRRDIHEYIWWPPNTLVNFSKCLMEHMEIAIAIAIVSIAPYTTAIMKHNQCACSSLCTNRKLENYKLVLSKTNFISR
jgi:hypothetical protein